MRNFIGTVGLAVVFVSLAYAWPAAFSLVTAEEKDDKAEAAKKELEALQGTWKLMTHEEEGKIVAYGDDVHLYTIEKDKMTVKRKGEVIAEGSIDLDPKKSPRHLDVRLTSGQTDLTIYIRVGDYLIQCGSRDGKTRPSDFATGTAKGGAYLLVLKREK